MPSYFFSGVTLLILLDCKMPLTRSRGHQANGTSPFLFFLIPLPLFSQDEVASGRQGTSSKHGGGTAGNSG